MVIHKTCRKFHLFFFTFLLLFLFIQNTVSARDNNYFQQDVEYNIDVLLEPLKGHLYGNYQLIYVNNSPDTLNSIFIHLYPNAYGSTKSALAQELILPAWMKNSVYFAKEEQQGYIDQLDFTSPDQNISVRSIEQDISEITLDKPLLPGDSIQISTPFRIKIPSFGFSRMGKKNKNYQITQWFPKPAVYDDKGWHLIPNRNIGEFYGEFGDFHIRLMVPENYTTGSTGKRIKEKPWKEEHLPGFDVALLKEQPYKTIYVKAENVHTFAWCSGKDYKRISRSFQIENTNKIIKSHILYLDDKEHWQEQLEVIEDAVNFYSTKIGTYPYSVITVAQSVGVFQGGMEYPMFTFVDKTSGLSQETVIMHEIGHNWFYGVLGFNEREHPWMDEGINTFYENQYMKAKYPQLNYQDFIFGEDIDFNFAGIESLDYEDIPYLAYKMLAGKNLDKPATLHSSKYSAIDYFIHTYYKPAQMFAYIQSLVGREKFNEFMQSFWNKWKFKHPQPEDFYEHFKSHFPEYGYWFIEEMLTTAKRVDYKIQNVNTTKDSITLTIKNKENLAAPFKLALFDQNNKADFYSIPGFKGKKKINLPREKNFRIKIDPNKNLPETKRSNNNYDNSKLFPKANKFAVKWIYHVPQPDKSYLFHTPVVGYNGLDKFMPGWILYNDPVFSSPFHFRIAPLYSIKNQEINGEGRINYTVHTGNKNLQAWQLSTYAKKYNYFDYGDKGQLNYLTIKPELNFYFKGKDTPGTKSSHKSGLRYHYMRKEYISQNGKNFYTLSPIIEGHYNYKSRQISHSKSFDLNMQYWNGYLKVSTEYNHRFRYDQKDNGVDIRVFAGTFLTQGNSKLLDMRFRLSNWSGDKDYLFNNTMLYRSLDDNQLFRRQMVIRDGGFNLMTPVGQSWKHLYALNTHIDFPLDIPLGAFFSAGDFGKSANEHYDNNIFWEAGVTFSIIKDNFRIYYTPFASEALKEAHNSTSLRFTLNLDIFNPFRLTKNVDPAFK
ncbi:MAG: M1 family metallopeptidase [Bacteroidales bacterium]